MIVKAEGSLHVTLWVLAVAVDLKGLDVPEAINKAGDLGAPYTQLLRLGVLVGPLHTTIASVTAYHRHVVGRGAARKPSIELLLRLAGERQVSRAVEKLGLKPGAEEACLVAVSPDRMTLDALAQNLEMTVKGECRWGGVEAAVKYYLFNPASCPHRDLLRCAELHAASTATTPEIR